MSQTAINVGFSILKLGRIRDGDQFHSPGRIYSGQRDAPQCFECGRDGYETQLMSADGGGTHFFYCLEHEKAAAYELLMACSTEVDLQEPSAPVRLVFTIFHHLLSMSFSQLKSLIFPLALKKVQMSSPIVWKSPIWPRRLIPKGSPVSIPDSW